VPTGKYLAVLGYVRPGWSKLRLVSQEEKRLQPATRLSHLENPMLNGEIEYLAS
jgi:hypothetical protein